MSLRAVRGDGSLDWLGLAPFDTLPTLLNPSDGVIVSANNRVVPHAAVDEMVRAIDIHTHIPTIAPRSSLATGTTAIGRE